ncbi:hypothetical protein [Kitasatospora sp. NPDC094016]|uniref:hypothetical protein n=1 Tax=Kitasatospora sp. NPDC094016 TaxID=3154986 RepID=UPI00331F14F0
MPDTEQLLAQNNDGALLVAEPAALLIPVGRYVGFLWFVVVSRTLWRRDGGAPLHGPVAYYGGSSRTRTRELMPGCGAPH